MVAADTTQTTTQLSHDPVVKGASQVGDNGVPNFDIKVSIPDAITVYLSSTIEAAILGNNEAATANANTENLILDTVQWWTQQQQKDLSNLSKYVGLVQQSGHSKDAYNVQLYQAYVNSDQQAANGWKEFSQANQNQSNNEQSANANFTTFVATMESVLRDSAQ